MTALTDGERETLLTPCGCGHSINDHGTLCWVCADASLPNCPHDFEELLVERLDGIVAGRVKARLAGVEALADEWDQISGDNVMVPETRFKAPRSAEQAADAPVAHREARAAYNRVTHNRRTT